MEGSLQSALASVPVRLLHLCWVISLVVDRELLDPEAGLGWQTLKTARDLQWRWLYSLHVALWLTLLLLHLELLFYLLQGLEVLCLAPHYQLLSLVEAIRLHRVFMQDAR